MGRPFPTPWSASRGAPLLEGDIDTALSDYVHNLVETLNNNYQKVCLSQPLPPTAPTHQWRPGDAVLVKLLKPRTLGEAAFSSPQTRPEDRTEPLSPPKQVRHHPNISMICIHRPKLKNITYDAQNYTFFSESPGARCTETWLSASIDRTQDRDMFSYIQAYVSKYSVKILHAPNTLNDSYWGGILKGYTASRLTRPIPHAYWMCNNTLRSALPVNWTGTCGLVTVAQELLIQQTSDMPASSRRTKRSAYSHNVYIDAIGVPRGIPSELKAQGEVSAGFASILPYIQINKNVAWINYVYYNQQRHTNLTNTALKALGEQMSATSLMTMQNRMALDMLLAEKGGVCAMFGDVCCTFIPNNTTPNGSFTQAMNRLEALQIELRANAGHGQWLDKWMQDTFGKWKELIVAFVTIVAYYVITFCLYTIIYRILFYSDIIQENYYSIRPIY
uniref:Uncharacterized protein n=1 Tax=Astatotilapia calliptera TaxID=8154 RepID=A0A3P8Q4G3_ASTCA